MSPGRHSRPVRQRLLIAPHLDDGALSLGGTLLAARQGPATGIRTRVATVFSRSNYTREGLGDVKVATPIRQAEERAVMSSIGVDVLFLGFLECPLRGYTISHPLDYPKQFLAELDAGIVERISGRLAALFAEFDEILVPLAVGERAHVDHRIVRTAASLAWKSHPAPSAQIYEDIPYIRKPHRDCVSALDGLRLVETAIDLEAKVRLTRGYESQPVEAWEPLLRQTAGNPPVERTWTVREPAVLERLRIADGDARADRAGS